MDLGNVRLEQQIQILTRVGEFKEVEPLPKGDWMGPHTTGQRKVTGTVRRGFYFSLNPPHSCVKMCYHPHCTDQGSPTDSSVCCPGNL